jgi:hypothetical protein
VSLRVAPEDGVIGARRAGSGTDADLLNSLGDLVVDAAAWVLRILTAAPFVPVGTGITARAPVNKVEQMATENFMLEFQSI